MNPVEIVGIVVATVLGAISALHLFWAIVGVSGTSAVLPEVDGRPAFVPGRFVTFLVALALALATYTVLASAGLAPFPAIGFKTPASSTALLGVVLLARAIGDFRWVGFFKSIRQTRFAYWDTRLFSPLCLALSLGSLWLAASG